MANENPRPHPHKGQKILTAGGAIAAADMAMILIHGRGAAAESILSLAEPLARPQCVYLAPQAKENTWYPYPFLAPIEKNEPFLSSALQVVADLLAQLEAGGIPRERTILGGFSQGACLASEFVARNAHRYGGLFAFSGGVIGPEGTPREYAGSLEGTPVFIGCSDRDPHIPLPRVHETAEVLRSLGGDVAEQIYPGMGHTVNRDELEHVRSMVESL